MEAPEVGRKTNQDNPQTSSHRKCMAPHQHNTTVAKGRLSRKKGRIKKFIGACNHIATRKASWRGACQDVTEQWI